MRLLIGMTILLACFFGVRMMEKRFPWKVALSLRFLRFFQVPIIILFVAPACFERVGI